MFGNPFLKNDSLLEAVKAAQHDGECRRQAEKIVNEEFGVYSRKAVVREHLAAYDAALEKVYTQLREGLTVEPVQPVKNTSSSPNPTSSDISNPSAQTQSRARMGATPAVQEGKKPNDGNLANNYPPYDKVTRGDVIAGATGKDQMGGKKKVNEKKMWEGSMDGLPPSDAAKQAARQTSTPASTPAPTKTKDLSSTFSSARGATGMQEAQLDELSRTTLKSYVKKANRQANDLERKVNTRKDRPGEEDKMYRRIDGVNLAHDKMKVRVAATNEEALDEISKELAGKYIKSAHYRGGSADFKHGMIHGRELATRKKSKGDQADAKQYSNTSLKREKGIGLAADKLTGKAKVAANEEIMKESIIAKLFARHMKEDSSF